MKTTSVYAHAKPNKSSQLQKQAQAFPAIKAITGHRSDAIVGRYLKQADKLKTNAHRLPGVGLVAKG